MRTIVRVVAAVCLIASLLYVPTPGRAAFPGGNGPIVWAAGNTRFGIWTMSPDGSGQFGVTSNRFDTGPDWSADGSRIAFEREGDVYVMNADGTGATNLTNSPTIQDGNPSWSPDGTRIAWASVRQNSDIFVMNDDGTGEVQLTSDSRYDDFPEWAPDGSAIAFVAVRLPKTGPTTGRGIYVMAPDGSGQTHIADTSYNNPRLDWSPDSSRIVYDTDFNIWTVNRDGTTPMQLTLDGNAANGVAWSPDGAQIAYTSDRGGDWDIYVTSATQQDTNGTLSVNITNTTGNDFYPDWGVARPVPGCDPEQQNTTCGTQGNDDIEVSVDGASRDILVQTGDGADTVELRIVDPSNPVSVTIETGDHGDTVIVPPSAGQVSVRIESGSGNDVIRPDAASARARVTSQQGSVRGYVVLTGGGSDRVTAGIAGDTVDGGRGKDNVNGAGGADKLGGGGGGDAIEGGAGSDQMNGGGGTDVLHGSGGRNVFIGGAGRDTCLSDTKLDSFRSCERIRRNHRRNHQQV